jgi:hypothetical protein
VRLIGETARERDVTESMIAREHQIQGTFNPAFENEPLWWLTKKRLEAARKMRPAQFDIGGKLGNPSSPSRRSSISAMVF